MSLLNMQSTNGYLEAVGGDGEAVSLQRVQATGTNISTATLADTLETSTVIVDGDGLFIEKNDGSFHSIVASSVQSSTNIGSINNFIQTATPYAYAVSNLCGSFMLNGSFYVLDRPTTTSGTLHKFNLNNGRMTGMTFVGTNSGLSGSYVCGLYISPDGSKLFYYDVNYAIYRYDMSTPFDITTLAFHSSGTIPNSTVVYNGGIYFTPDGLTVFISGRGDTSVRSYTLPAPYDITTLTPLSTYTHGQTDFYGTSFTSDGRKFIGMDYGSDVLREYNMATPFDIANITVGTTKSHTGINESIFSISDDGHIAIIRDHANGNFIELYGETSLLEISKYTMDTTNITAGEIPNKVYLASDTEADLADARNISMDVEFATISTSLTQAPLVIATSDHTGDSAATGTVTSTYQSFDNAWKAFDRTTNVGTASFETLYYPTSSYYGGNPPWLKYSFTNPTTLAKVRMLTDSIYDHTPKSFYIDGSHDNTNWTRLYTGNETTWGALAWKEFVFANQDAYTHYKITFATSRGTVDPVALREIEFYKEDGTADFDLLKATTLANGDKLAIVKSDNSIHEVIASGVTGTGPYQMDTTAITAGEIPTQVYRLNPEDASVLFNNVLALDPIDTLTFDTTLKSTRTFDDVELAGRTLETKVNLAKGNKMTRLSADIYKA